MGCEKRWVARDEEFLDGFCGLRYWRRCAARALFLVPHFFAAGVSLVGLAVLLSFA